MNLKELEVLIKTLNLEELKKIRKLVNNHYKLKRKEISSKRLVDTYTNQYGVYFRLEKVFCNKDNCSSCKEGVGHGPYWYSYKNGTRSYIGKKEKDQLKNIKPFSKSVFKENKKLPYKL